MNTTNEALAEAINKLGGTKSTAEKLNISQQAVYKFLNRGALPHRHCIEVSELTGIKRYKLNPVGYLKTD